MGQLVEEAHLRDPVPRSLHLGLSPASAQQPASFHSSQLQGHLRHLLRAHALWIQSPCSCGTDIQNLEVGGEQRIHRTSIKTKFNL